jgi:hypothetical protein
MSTTPQDSYGYFGPEYNFAANIALPGEIGVRQEPSVGAIIDSVAGVNYYVDVIAFGGPTFFDSHNPEPMGARYFLNTEMRCSNGATMSAYFDGVTKGNLLGDSVADALASAGLPGLKGLAPGMLENARDALDPRPILSAVTASGYPVCQQVQCPIGDVNGSIKNAREDTPYILDPVDYVNGMPTQTRWVQAYDSTGSALQITKDEFAAQPKCYNADGTYMENPATGCASAPPPPQGSAGSDPYGLCTVLQPATMPPTLESFEDRAEAERRMWALVGIAAVSVGAVWLLTRR